MHFASLVTFDRSNEKHSLDEVLMKLFVMVAILILGLLALPPKSNVGALAKPDIRGKITEIRRATPEDEERFIGTVLVEADKNSSVDKANLIVTRKTRIFKQQDGKKVQIGFDELKVEERLEASFEEGPVVMMYPLRVAAAEIVILE